MLLRVLFLLLATMAFFLSLYKWGWRFTLAQLHRWGAILLEDIRRLWSEACEKEQGGAKTNLPPGLLQFWALLKTMRCFLFALRRVYLNRLLDLPWMIRLLSLSQRLFPALLLFSLALLCGAKYFFWGAPIEVCLVHFLLGSNAIFWIHRSHQQNGRSVLYLNLGFCYLYAIILLLFFVPPLLPSLLSHLPQSLRSIWP